MNSATLGLYVAVATVRSECPDNNEPAASNPFVVIATTPVGHQKTVFKENQAIEVARWARVARPTMNRWFRLSSQSLPTPHVRSNGGKSRARRKVVLL